MEKASTVSPLGYFGCVWIPSLIGTNNAFFVDLSQRLLCTLLEDDRYEVEQFSGGTVLVEGDWCDLCCMLLTVDNVSCTLPLSFFTIQDTSNPHGAISSRAMVRQKESQEMMQT